MLIVQRLNPPQVLIGVAQVAQGEKGGAAAELAA